MPREQQAGSRFEEAGIPDLQDGTPEQQWSGDPEEEPLPGDVPVGANEWGTTVDEQSQGEPLDLRLSREQADFPAQTPETDIPGNLYEPTNFHAGRLVEPDEGAHTDVDKDLVARDFGADGGGYTAEEAAMHIEPEDTDR